MTLFTGLLRVALLVYARRHDARLEYRDGIIAVSREARTVLIPQRHAIYAPDLILNFDAYWNSVRDSNGTIDFSSPAVFEYRDSGLKFWLPSFPEESSALLSYFRDGYPRPGDVVFDIGAHCGVSAYHFAQRVGATGHVYAFEPDPGSFEYLQRNIALHRLTNVTAIPVAIAGRSGRRSFNNDSSQGAAFSDLVFRGGSSPHREVEALTLADACRHVGAEPAFVKLDVEGAEVEIVEGAADFLRTRDIRFALDTSHAARGLIAHLRHENTAPAVERAFQAVGYSADSEGGTTWAWRRA
jgi:FkbM family methyltransferase